MCHTAGEAPFVRGHWAKIAACGTFHFPQPLPLSVFFGSDLGLGSLH